MHGCYLAFCSTEPDEKATDICFHSFQGSWLENNAIGDVDGIAMALFTEKGSYVVLVLYFYSCAAFNVAGDSYRDVNPTAYIRQPFCQYLQWYRRVCLVDSNPCEYYATPGSWAKLR
jgi:hypothetical protein